MMIYGGGVLVLFCLAIAGLAVRGVALLAMRRVKPGRVISVTGVIAMISVWFFAGAAPFACAGFVEIYREFEVTLPPVTRLVIAFFTLPFRDALLWYPAALGLSFCALTMPEIFIRRLHPE
jgi:hypothetical protein